jgi:hypothetical protein
MKVDVFIDSFLIVHNGHVKIIKRMVEPCLIIVRNSYINKGLPIDYLKNKLRELNASIKFVQTTTSYLPILVDNFKTYQVEIRKLFCTDDQLEIHQNNLEKTHKNMVQCEIIDDVRPKTELLKQIVVASDRDSFKHLTPKLFHDDFDYIKSLF